MKRVAFPLLLALLGSVPKAHAYPDLIRHNYANCSTCHVSPTGGGMLTAYGRGMSKEILSMFGAEGEEKPLHGLIPGEFPEWLLIGGDVRAIQIHQANPQKVTGRGFLMQANVGVGVDLGKVKAVAVLGEAVPERNGVQMAANRFYALWNPQDELAIRAGRFVPVFGLNVPYHTLPTRAALGFGPGAERNTVEAVWSGEEWNIAASASRSQARLTTLDNRESLFTAQVNRTFGGSLRAGLSFAEGFQKSSERRLYGAHGTLGLSEKWAYLTEFTFQHNEAYGTAETTGLYHFSQLLFEPWKGLSFYLLETYKKTDLKKSATLANSAGPGFRFFPRPHFEFDFVFLKTRTASVADRYDDMAWLVGHYYF